MVLNLHRRNMHPWGREGDDWVMERQAGEKKKPSRGCVEWGADLPNSLNALLMTAKGESALEIGEEELPLLYRLPSYK